jgi:hypothetical protein
MPSFVEGDFDQDVQEGGLWTIWEQRYPCPCRSSDHGSPTEQPDVLCQECKGTGDAYHSPATIKVVYAQPELNHNELVVWGEWLGGQTLATPRSEFLFGHRDRLTVVDSLYVAEDLKERPERGELLELHHPIATREVEWQRDGLNPCVPEAALSEDDADPCSKSTFGRRITSQRVTFLGYHKIIGETSEGLQRELVVLREGEDYLITDDGKIDLSPGDSHGTTPPPGTMMSVTYLAHPVWIVAQYAPYAAQFTYQTEQTEDPILIELPKTMKCELDIYSRNKRDQSILPRDLGGV